MTQLSKAIAKLQRGSGPAVGFIQAKRDAPKTLLLAAEVSDEAGATAALDAGADFYIARGANAAAVIAAVGKKNHAAARVDALDDATAKALTEAGAIFVACEPSTARSSAIDTDALGFVAIIDPALDEQTLRALGGLGLDGLATLAASTPETLADQLQIVRLALLGGAPIIAPVGAGATTIQLRVLRDSGVAIVVAGAECSKDEVAALNAAIKALPPKKKGDRDGGAMAMIPSSGSRGGGEEHEHEEDDGDDE